MPITNVTSAYLALYNLACMCGWGYALVLAGQSLAKTGGDLSKVWEAMGTSIHVAQWAMSLEMVHALLKLVNSPFLATVLQVLSRLLLMVVIMLAPSASKTWQCGMMAISWALVEVPRYCFYLNGLLGPGGQTGVLYPIFWLRYSLFAILYPTGITGEVHAPGSR
jgi:very-long-chain (3R)-3-hydroxyacyl-CoA dehydratase